VRSRAARTTTYPYNIYIYTSAGLAIERAPVVLKLSLRRFAERVRSEEISYAAGTMDPGNRAGTICEATGARREYRASQIPKCFAGAVKTRPTSVRIYITAKRTAV